MTESDARLPLVCLLASTETSPSVVYGLFDVLSTVGAIFREMTVGEEGNLVFYIKGVGATSEIQVGLRPNLRRPS